MVRSSTALLCSQAVQPHPEDKRTRVRKRTINVMLLRLFKKLPATRRLCFSPTTALKLTPCPKHARNIDMPWQVRSVHTKTGIAGMKHTEVKSELNKHRRTASVSRTTELKTVGARTKFHVASKNPDWVLKARFTRSKRSHRHGSKSD